MRENYELKILSPDQITIKAHSLRNKGARLSQICSVRTKDGFDLLYSYVIDYTFKNYKVSIKEDAEIENIDATLIMERPKVAPYIDAMCENIANALKISRNKVAIKATTTEGMGFTGTKEGAAASAVCLVKKLG